MVATSDHCRSSHPSLSATLRPFRASGGAPLTIRKGVGCLPKLPGSVGRLVDVVRVLH